MGQYIKLFQTHSEYTAFTQTEDFLLPNVSYCEDQTDVVHYSPIPHYARLYNGTEMLSQEEIDFSLEDGHNGYYGVNSSFGGPHAILLYSSTVPYNAIEIEIFKGISNISITHSDVAGGEEDTDVTYQINGNILRIQKSEGSWEPACYTPSLWIHYTCNNSECRTMAEVNNCD